MSYTFIIYIFIYYAFYYDWTVSTYNFQKGLRSSFLFFWKIMADRQAVLSRPTNRL